MSRQFEQEIRKMKAALTNVEITEGWPELDSRGTAKLLSESRPPSYLVRAALEMVFGYRLPRVHEKSAWGIPVSYRGEKLEISDWKRSTWNIWGRDSDSAREAAKGLGKKLSAAARILNGLLEEVCRDLLEKDDLSLDNQFHRYNALFDLFRSECETIWKNLSVPSQAPVGIALGTHLESFFALRAANSMKLQANLLAASIFFFSLSEVIFDACFALGDRNGMSYKEFRKLKWAERFKLLIPLVDSEMRQTYERLLDIRRLYRNIPVHAEPVLAFDIDCIGLIAATCDDLDNPNLESLYFTKNDNAESVLACLGSALDLFERHQMTQFGFAYARSGLAIHISQRKLIRLREHMQSIDTFRAFLVELAEYTDAVLNMEV